MMCMMLFCGEGDRNHTVADCERLTRGFDLHMILPVEAVMLFFQESHLCWV